MAEVKLVTALGSKSTFNQLMATSKAKSYMPSYTLNFEATLPGSFYVGISHSRGLEWAKTEVKDISTVTFGFKKESKN